MKAKLLKKLRKIYIIKERNGKYKVFKTRECSGGIFNQTEWIDKNKAFEIRRKWILQESRRYEVAKNVL